MPIEEKKPARVGSVLRAYSVVAVRYPKLLTGALLATFVIEISGLIAPLYLKQFINVLAAGKSPGVMQAIVWILATYAAINLVGWVG